MGPAPLFASASFLGKKGVHLPFLGKYCQVSTSWLPPSQPGLWGKMVQSLPSKTNGLVRVIRYCPNLQAKPSLASAIRVELAETWTPSCCPQFKATKSAAIYHTSRSATVQGRAREGKREGWSHPCLPLS